MKIGLRMNGKAIGIDPGDRTYVVYANRDVIGPWEDAELMQSAAGWWHVRFLAANRQLTITPDGKLESRPAGAIGEWEQHTITTVAGRAVLGRAGVSLVVEGFRPLPALRISGLDFVTESDARRVLNGCDQFLAFRHFLDGVSLEPLFAESHGLGFDMWRVFMMGSKRQNNILDLSPSESGFYDRVRPFAEALNAQGIILLAAIFVDAQDVMSSVSARQSHWRAMAERLRGTTTLLSGGNEWNKNGFNPGELADPGMLWSRGSGTSDAAPFKPYGSFAEFHPRRDLPASLLDSVASPVTLYGQGLNVPLIIDEPIGFAEADIPGSRSADPRLAYRLARHYSTECAGAVYHNDSGQRGQVMSSRVRACAEAWQRGMSL